MLVKRTVRTPDGGVLSMRMEQKFWNAFMEICRREGCRPGVLVRRAEESRAPVQDNVCRTAAVRVFILSYFLDAATEEGHQEAGHGRPVAWRGFGGPESPMRQEGMAA